MSQCPVAADADAAFRSFRTAARHSTVFVAQVRQQLDAKALGLAALQIPNLNFEIIATIQHSERAVYFEPSGVSTKTG